VRDAVALNGLKELMALHNSSATLDMIVDVKHKKHGVIKHEELKSDSAQYYNYREIAPLKLRSTKY
jgi:hypothetical protein